MKFTFAPEATPLPGFTIKRAIDRGGFGEVYYALSDSGKEVALKLLQRNQQVELRGVSQCLNLKHPNLVTIFDIKVDADGDHWVVMEYVSGKSLEQVLDGHPQGLELAEVEAWLAGIAAGTAFLHDRGIVHRDLKPANVFRENGVVKIGDVGLSKFITPSRRSAQTESVGTVYYMAPEVARGRYGSELDIYSAGVMLYEMITGHVPFSGESTGEILMKHLTEPPDLTKIPSQFRAVIGRALEKDPQRRTPGMLQLLEDFRRARQGKPIAEEIPASHFVDVERLERLAKQHDANDAAGAAPRNGHDSTVHYGAGGGQAAPRFERPKPPEIPQPFARECGKTWRQFQDEMRKRPWLAVLIALALSSVVFGGPRLPMGRGLALGELVLLAGASAATYFVVTKLIKPSTGPSAASRAAPVAAAVQTVPRPEPVQPPQRPAQQPGVQPVIMPARPAPPAPPRRPNQTLSPNVVRPIALRQRVAELTGSMTMAVLWGAIATAAVWALAGHIPLSQHARDLLAQPTGLGMFGFTTVLGAWAVLVSSKLWEGSGIDPRHRRVIQTALGAAVGACAFLIQNQLLIDLGFQSTFPGLVRHVGQFELLTASPNVQPTLAAYVLYFAALFGIRRWWWLADSFRPKRFRILSVVFSGLVAFLLPAAFAFHQEWGALWGVALAAVVQLSTAWVPVKERPALVLPPGARGNA